LSGPIFGGRAWVPALVVLPMFLGFAFGGVQGGTAIGALTLALVVVWAVRADPEDQIEVAEPGPDVSSGILVVVLAAIEEPRVAGVLAAIGDPSREEAGESGLLVLAPAQISRMDRWTGDLEAARFESQRVLAVSVATLAAAGIEAEGRVGDGDLVVATEDVLRTFAATEVVVVASPGEQTKELAALERRLAIPLRRIS
jgi:hypothetical protein